MSKNINKRTTKMRESGTHPKPPGVVFASKGHGLQTATVTVVGVGHLRQVLDLSVDVGMDSLCEAGAAEIELLRRRLRES